MNQHRTLLLQLCSRPDMRRLFPHEPEEPADGQLLQILERLWPIVREASVSDADCLQNIEMIVRFTVSLADSGRLF